MPKQHLVEKYRLLVQQEEERIAKLTRDRFAKLRNIDTHPSMILGTQYGKTTYDKQSYNYLRQRYYRLKRIKTAEIREATTSYSFDSWMSVIKNFVQYFGFQNESRYHELLRIVAGMTIKQKETFIAMGLNYNLRQEYNDLGEDAREGRTTTLDHVISRLETAINNPDFKR